jgi:hypothetical protein
MPESFEIIIYLTSVNIFNNTRGNNCWKIKEQFVNGSGFNIQRDYSQGPRLKDEIFIIKYFTKRLRSIE